MNLSGQARAGKTQIVPCNYLTIDLAEALYKGQKKMSSNTGLENRREINGPFEATQPNSPLKQV